MEHQQIKVLLIHPEEEEMDSKKEWRGMRGNVSFFYFVSPLNSVAFLKALNIDAL
jgi:hypothetical protein